MPIRSHKAPSQRVVDLHLEPGGGNRFVLHLHRLGDGVDVLLVGLVDALVAARLHAERRGRRQEDVGRWCVTERGLHHVDLTRESSLTAIVDGRGAHPILDGLSRLLGTLRHMLGGSRLLEQRAVLQHGEIEVTELDPVGAREQQLAERTGMPGRLVATEARREVLRPVAAFRELAFVDEVDPGTALRVAHLPHRRGQAFVPDVEPSPDVMRCRQGTDVGSENPVRAASHGVPQRSSERSPERPS